MVVKGVELIGLPLRTSKGEVDFVLRQASPAGRFRSLLDVDEDAPWDDVGKAEHVCGGSVAEISFAAQRERNVKR